MSTSDPTHGHPRLILGAPIPICPLSDTPAPAPTDHGPLACGHAAPDGGAGSPLAAMAYASSQIRQAREQLAWRGVFQSSEPPVRK